MSDQEISSGGRLSRRELGKLTLSGALGSMALGWSQSSVASTAAVHPELPGIHLALDAPVHPTEEDFLFFKQVGVDVVYVRGTKPEDQTVEGLLALKKRYADAGLTISDVDYHAVTGNLGDIVLNRPGRDKAIEAYRTWIRTAAQAGFHSIEAVMFSATARVESGDVETRGGTHDRGFDLNSPELTGSRVSGKGSASSLLFGRKYGPDEIWENYTYFVRQIAPVAEEAGVWVGFALDDPPTTSLFGVACIFSSFEDCKKALKIANSPNVGMCLGCGEWLEDGAAMGIDLPGAVRYFASKKQLFEVHFRNASSTLPRFHETYVDDGYYDMYKIMKTLVDVKFDGVVPLDHFVRMVGGRRTYDAFGIGYMRAMLQCAQRGYHA
jgi:mannonate dehydratase